MRYLRWPVWLTAAVALAACGGGADPEVAPAPETPAATETVTSEPLPDEPLTAELFGLAFQLPGLPDDPTATQPVASEGNPVDLARLNTNETWLWCDDRDGNGLFATAIVGDIWKTNEGAGVLMGVSSELAPGTYPLPSSAEEFVVFLVDMHGEAGIPTEYSSNEQESFGEVTIESVPCGEGGDTLSFTIDGGLGAETNPGFAAAVRVAGEVEIVQNGQPPDWPWFPEE